MKLQFKFIQLQLFTLSAGLLGILLRVVLFTTGIDENGLLVSGHWARSGLLALSVLVCLVLAPGCAFGAVPGKHPGRSRSLVAGAGCFLCAAGFLMSALADRRHISGGVDALSVVFGFVCAGALVFIGIHRCIGRIPHFSAHTLVSLGFATRMVCQYRFWSSDPQLSDYCFYMLSHVALMLTSYHWAANDAGLDGFRKLRFFGLLSVYFCMVSVYGSKSGLFMALCAIWVLTNLPFCSGKNPGAKPDMKGDA